MLSCLVNSNKMDETFYTNSGGSSNKRVTGFVLHCRATYGAIERDIPFFDAAQIYPQSYLPLFSKHVYKQCLWFHYLSLLAYELVRDETETLRPGIEDF